MRKRISGFTLALFAIGCTPSWAYDQALSKTYATSAATALYAQEHCKDLHADASRINLFKSRAGLMEQDDAFVQTIIKDQQSQLEGNFQKMGEEAWCVWAFNSLGSKSSLFFLRKRDLTEK